ncbi:P1 family peptidase [Candidatus Phycosocius spiralis]|uniref:Peptidase T4 n=1 Tax=Candidatus Phycosocius spiralis TaxID=2815099 RepID=A0ABQ4PU12_9PROT|nr:P1 family peptidase [Candidatus Phycosocius spiralis]GIU66213.1 peptidase T4 [Candidatus Phycosocius spiralis]
MDQLHNRITDVPGLRIGHAEDVRALTGVTVIYPDAPAVCGVDMRGGGPGTRETDALAPENLVDAIDALVLSGGSVYGLGAADGVVAKLGALGRGFRLMDLPDIPRSPVVPAAILYDLANGGQKDWGVTPPYYELGKAALDRVTVEFALGAVGAGIGARAGQLRGGLGSASQRTSEGIHVGAIVAVNCFGSVIMPGTDAFWAWPLEQNGEAGGYRPDPSLTVDGDDWGAAKADPSGAMGRTNTTIACVATDVALTPAQAKRMAQMASAGLARAIRPVFAPFDGDVVFALSTAHQPLAEPSQLTITRIGALAADCLARAVMRGVYAAKDA